GGEADDGGGAVGRDAVRGDEGAGDRDGVGAGGEGQHLGGGDGDAQRRIAAGAGGDRDGRKVARAGAVRGEEAVDRGHQVVVVAHPGAEWHFAEELHASGGRAAEGDARG